MKKNIIYTAAMAMLTVACSNEDDTFLSGFENNGVGNTKMMDSIGAHWHDCHHSHQWRRCYTCCYCCRCQV